MPDILTNGYVDIELDKPRRLLFDFNATCDFETAMGVSIMHLMYKVSKASEQDAEEGNTVIGFRELRAMLWAALRHEDKTLTIDQAGKLVERAPGTSGMSRMTYVLTHVLESWTRFLGPEASKKVEAEMPSKTPS